MRHRWVSTLPDIHAHNNRGNEILFSINISPPLTTIPEMDGVGQWLGLTSHQTSRQWPSSYGATLKPWFTRRPVDSEEDLIGFIVEAAATTRQQLGILEHNLCCATVGCVSRSVAVHFNICSKLVQNTTFFLEYFSGFAWFPNLVRPILTSSRAARMHLWQIVPWQQMFVLVPSITSQSLAKEFFRTYI